MYAIGSSAHVLPDEWSFLHLSKTRRLHFRGQLNRYPEPLPCLGDILRLGQLHVPNQRGAKFSSSPVHLWWLLGTQRSRRCFRLLIAENFATGAGCYLQDGEIATQAGPNSKETTFRIDHAGGKTVCIPPQSMGGRNTMADLLDGANLTWTYYSSAYSSAGQDKGGSLWTAPNALQAICVPDANFQNCTGTEWKNHVVINPPQVLSDLGTNGGTCDLKNVSWVIPTGPNSDHPGGSSTGGPNWVASIVNALGESRCTDTINGQSFTYWQDTAVVITWDDWGGFYDHERPTILASPEGSYQLGFRVPMIFVSAYTPAKYINNARHDFGSVLRFIEHNFDLGEGVLGFADKRATNNLASFYNLRRSPRTFISIPTSKTVTDFINDKTPPQDVDEE